jgi:ABC-type multidrug transport system permease subunit
MLEEKGPSGHAARRVEGHAPAAHYRPLLELTLTRMREFLREKEAVFWVFVFPVLLACALGIAFRSTGPEKVRVGVESGRNAAVSARVAAALSQSPDIQAVVLSPEEAGRALRVGSVSMVVRPGDAERDAGNSRGDETGAGGVGTGPLPSSFDYRFDPSRPDSRLAKLSVDAALAAARGQQSAFNAREERVTESGGRYIDFLIPGLIGLNLMGSGMWGIGFSIVTARGRKLLKRFAATPMRRSHYLLSFMLSRLAFLFVEVVFVLGFARLVFGVRIHGSLAGVAVLALVGGLTFSGLGLLVAARPTTVEGVSGLMNFVMLPMWLLSGTFFSSERFPAFLQPAIKALPLTAVNDSLRSVINEGAPLLANWRELSVLLIWCVVSFVVALRIFRWQ